MELKGQTFFREGFLLSIPNCLNFWVFDFDWLKFSTFFLADSTVFHETTNPCKNLGESFPT